MTHAGQAESRAMKAILQLLADYFDGLYGGDVQSLQRVFHPRAIYICAAPGDFQYLTMPQYWERVAQRQSPAQTGQRRMDRVLAIELAGPCAALARVNCAIADRYFTDLLSLACIDGQWRIVSKVFDYQLREPAFTVDAADA